MVIIMRSEKKNLLKFLKIKKINKIIAVLVVLFVSMILGGVMYAKYYAEGYEKGIAIASGIYFTANYAVETQEEDYYESLVLTEFTGDGYKFDFEVRNYENNLLFNENSVVIPYSISFWLEEAPQTAVYSVKYGSETVTLSAGKPVNAVFSNHSILGGSAMLNKYTISVTQGSDKDDSQIPVYAEIKTDAGAIINSTLRGKMVFTSSSLAENYIESQHFIGASGEKATMEEIKKQSAFKYEIKTVGEVASGENSTSKIKLSWNANIFEIDIFDEFYSPPVSEGDGWKSIVFEALPYSAMTVGFFRGESFDEQNITGMEDMHSYIRAELYQD